MRLWHQQLISKLPRTQLLGQHRECCALRGNGWGKKHATVDYVFSHPYRKLFDYHQLIMQEMIRRGYNVSAEWWEITYRGKSCPPFPFVAQLVETNPIYPEHDACYLEECLLNLLDKGIDLT